MSALATGLGRTICLTALFLMASTVVVLGSWHFGWLRHGLADLAHVPVQRTEFVQRLF